MGDDAGALGVIAAFRDGRKHQIALVGPLALAGLVVLAVVASTVILLDRR